MTYNRQNALFDTIAILIMTLLAFVCILPFLLIITGSVTLEQEILTRGYSLIPRNFSGSAYRTLFRSASEILRAYGVSIFVTAVGSTAGLGLTAMTGYVLSRKSFRFRNKLSFFFFFTTMFSGGLVPWYILMVSVYRMKDSLAALIVPSLLAPFFILIMRNYMQGLPESIVESAKMDGAGEFTIFVRLILPMSTPVLATILLYLALEYWNAWLPALLFIDDRAKFPLQYFLYRMLSSVRFASVVSAKSGVPMPELPAESIKLAMSVIATGPIIFAYPFVQRYFIKGLTIGAVKG